MRLPGVSSRDIKKLKSRADRIQFTSAMKNGNFGEIDKSYLMTRAIGSLFEHKLN
jgi:hypothetical protein